MAVRIQLRRDLAANWTAANTVLASGEIGFETDTGKFKIGNGSTSWTSLSYATVLPSDFSEVAQDAINTALVAGTGLDKTYDDSSNTITIDIDSTVATKTYADDAVSTHNSDTTSVHGIADTSELATKQFAAELLTNASKTNITITGDKNGLAITAENGVADSTTSDLAEGSNLYFTDERAQDAIGNHLGTGLSYNDSTGSISVTANTYDPYGSASTAQTNAQNYADSAISTHNSDTTSVHGITDTADLATKTGNNEFTGSNTFNGVSNLNGGAFIVSPNMTGLARAENLTVEGNLVVNGTTTTVNTAELAVADNIIYLNEAIQFDVTNAVGDGTYVTYTIGTHNIDPMMQAKVTGITPSGLNITSYAQVLSVTSTTITLANTSTDTYVSGGTLYAKAAISPDLGFVGSYEDNSVYLHAGFVRDASDGKFKPFSNLAAEPGVSIDFTSATLSGISAGNSNFSEVVTPSIDATNGTIDTLISTTITATTSNATDINTDTLGANDITTGTVDTGSITATSATITGATVTNGTVTNITSDTINTDDINSVSGSIDTLVSDDITVTNDVTTNTLNAATVTTGSLVADSITMGDISSTEIFYLEGVTSNIQVQLNSKLASSTAASTYETIENVNLKAPINNPTFTGAVTVNTTAILPADTTIGDVSDVEIGFLNGVTSPIQTQLNDLGTSLDTHENLTAAHGATGAVVGTTNNQILTNKTINASDNTITVTSANVSDFAEAAQDAIGNSVGTGLSYNDATGAISVTTNTYDAFGSASTAQTNAQNYADSAVSTHNSDTTNVHGIADTSLLATKTYADTAVSTHDADTSVHGVTGNVVGTTDTQILTNKTIDSASNTITVTSANVSDFTEAAQDAVGNSVGTGLSYNDSTGVVSVDTTSIQARVANVSDTEIGYLDGVTSGIQTQIDSKAPIDSPTFTGTVSGITKSMVGLGNVDNTSDANKPVSTATQSALDLKADLAGPTFTGTVTLPSTTSIGDVSSTEIGYVNGVTSAIQTQIDGKASLSGATFTGSVEIDQNLTVDGNLTVNGTTFSASSTSIVIEDNLVQLAHNNTGNTVDLGIVVGYNDGSTKHSGVVRDVSADRWKIFKGVTTEPSTTVDFTQGSLDDLEVAGLIATSATIGDVSNTELQYLNGVTSAIQTQIDTKAPLASPTFTGTVTLPSGTVTSTMIADGTIVDADINASAAIAKTKISGTAITAADTGTVTNTMLAGSITNDKLTNSTISGVSLGSNLNALTIGTGLSGTSYNGSSAVTIAIDSTVATLTGTQTLTNKTLTAPIMSVPILSTVGGDEGGQIEFGLAATNTTLSTGVAVDVYQDRLRIFETGGNVRGVFLNLASASNGVGSELVTNNGTQTLTNKTLTSPSMTSPTVSSGALTVSSTGITFSDGYTQTTAGVPSVTAISQKTTSYTLSSLTERDTIIEVNNASATTVTIPTDATLNYPVGTTLDVIQTGSGQVTIAGAVGVTVNATPGLKLRTQWSSVTLLKRAANTWLVYGDLTA